MSARCRRNTNNKRTCRQEAILSAISEKDSHIALLETSKAKNSKEDIDRLNADKQRLNLRLKDLVSMTSSFHANKLLLSLRNVSHSHILLLL